MKSIRSLIGYLRIGGLRGGLSNFRNDRGYTNQQGHRNHFAVPRPNH